MIDNAYELEDCPFCGSTATIETVKIIQRVHGCRSGYIEKYIAQCSSPHCVGRHGKPYVDVNTAVVKWNRRTAGSEVVVVNNSACTMDMLCDMITTAIRTARDETR